MFIYGRHRLQYPADRKLPVNGAAIVTVIIIIVDIGILSTWHVFSGQEAGVGFLGLGQSMREPCSCCPGEICDHVTADTFLFFLPVLPKVLAEPLVLGSTVLGNGVGQEFRPRLWPGQL